MKNKAVFLDRDGVLNRAIVRDGKPYPPASLAEFEILPGTKEALDKLKAAGYLLIVVTNQPDVGRGTQQKSIVEEMHEVLRTILPLDEIYVCYHGYDGECECRKPQPGMLLAAAREFKIDLKESFMIGDRSKDMEAGIAAGCKTIFIDYHYSEKLNIHPDLKTNSFELILKYIRKKNTFFKTHKIF